MGAFGSFVGSYVVGFLNAATGSPSASYMLMAVALLVALMMTWLVRPEPSDAPWASQVATAK